MGTDAPATAEAVLVPEVRLFVFPRDRTPAGTEIELTATVGDAIFDGRVTGPVVFLDGGEPVAAADLLWDEDTVYATATYTPTQGVHELSARYEGNPPEVSASTSSVTTYSVLPTTCADQAVPGAGAVVRLAYQAVLDRCPDRAGFAYWSDRLAGGASPLTVSLGLALSAEGVGAAVDGAYRQLLDRHADAGGRAVWAAKLRAGWTTSQLWAALAASPEFIVGVAGSDPTMAVVERAFTRIVGRPVDDASRTYWHRRLSSGGPRSATLRALTLTPEVLGHVVRSTYQDVLGRAASRVEQVADQADIKARRGNWRALAAGLLGRPEAATYAQLYPDPAS